MCKIFILGKYLILLLFCLTCNLSLSISLTTKTVPFLSNATNDSRRWIYTDCRTIRNCFAHCFQSRIGMRQTTNIILTLIYFFRIKVFSNKKKSPNNIQFWTLGQTVTLLHSIRSRICPKEAPSFFGILLNCAAEILLNFKSCHKGEKPPMHTSTT